MATTYGGDPSGSVLDAVRLLLGDTDCATAYLTDEEILYYLEEHSDRHAAAAEAALAIVAKLSRRHDYTTGSVSKSVSQLREHYEKLSKQLRQRAHERSGMISGGLTLTEKRSDALDRDAVQPAFSIGMDDNPRGIGGANDLTGDDT